MQVHLCFFAQARDLVGASSISLDMPPGSMARSVVISFARSQAARLQQLLLDPAGQISAFVLLAVGDRQLAADEDVPLKDGDEIMILPPVAGGAR